MVVVVVVCSFVQALQRTGLAGRNATFAYQTKPSRFSVTYRFARAGLPHHRQASPGAPNRRRGHRCNAIPVWLLRYVSLCACAMAS